MKKAYLVLANGKVFEGEAFGAVGNTVGELVFTTSVVGYLETMTDPNHYGQIVVQTFPMLGNYGVIEEDLLGKPYINGYVVREYCEIPSNFRSQYEIEKYMVDNSIIGICGVDTRELTKIIREEGSMNAVICTSLPADKALLESYEIKDAVKSVASADSAVYAAEDEKYKVTLVNFGSVGNLIKEFNARGCTVKTVAYTATAQEICEGADAVILSDGPGNPEEVSACVEEIKKINLPVFACGLGHCLLAMANGGKITKLKYGHHGSNQPVKYLNSERSYITAQNHGYVVEAESVNGAKLAFKNINDSTCAGLEYDNAVSVAFNAATCAGPQNTGFVFDGFITKMGGKN